MSPIGMMPEEKDLDLDGVKVTKEALKELLSVNTEAWKSEIEDIERFLRQFGDHYTDRLKKQVEALKERLKAGDR